jgi:murein DD-endopeptidase MepM/ murein hydrolase activator NlpD
VSRRAFLLALSGAVAFPRVALAADRRPQFDLFFPQDPVVTYFISTFGWERPGDRRHQGNDLLAPKMAPVYVAADGVVTRVTTGWGPGRHVAIDHGNQWETVYMHLNNDTPGGDDGKAGWEFTVGPGIEEGAWVQSGQLLGYVGDSGNAEITKPHTHFELRFGGRAIDPYPSLKGAHERALADLRRQKLAQRVSMLRLDGAG